MKPLCPHNCMAAFCFGRSQFDLRRISARWVTIESSAKKLQHKIAKQCGSLWQRYYQFCSKMATKNGKYYFKDSLRDYQKELLQLLLAAALNGRDGSYSADQLRVSPLVYLPTGAGKTRLASALMLSWLYHFPSARCAFLVNRRTLLRQGHAAISAASERWHDSLQASEATAAYQTESTPPHVGIIGGGSDCFPDAPLMVCSVQALLALRRKQAAAAAAHPSTADAPIRATSPLSLDDSSLGAHDEHCPPAATGPPSEALHSGRPAPPPAEHLGGAEPASNPPPPPPPAPPQDAPRRGAPRAQGRCIVGPPPLPLLSTERPPPPPRPPCSTTCTFLRAQPFERLGTVFSHLLMGPGVNTLTEEGVLVTPQHIAVHQVSSPHNALQAMLQQQL